MKKYRHLLMIWVSLFLLLGIHLTELDQVKAIEVIGESVPEKAPQIALTFDDGPHPCYTKELLDGLKEKGIHASFFLVGKNIEGNEEIVRQMKEDGHLIGNHTYDHVDLSRLPAEKACRQIEKTSNLIYEITGEYTIFVRPPFGVWRKNLDCAVNMFPVFWDVDPLDWNTENVDLIVKKIENSVQEGDIILMHDQYKTSVEAVFRIVDDLTAQGYEFVTVDEILLD